MRKGTVWCNCALAAITAAALVLGSCSLFGTRIAPVPGGAIQFTAISPTSVSLSWPAATSSSGGTLQYQLYVSTNPSSIATLEDIGSRYQVSPLTAWTAGMTSYTVNGLSSGTTYYFNVVVQDSGHSTAAYRQAIDAWTTAAQYAPIVYDMHDGGTLALNVSATGGPYNLYAITTNAGTGANAVPTVGPAPSVETGGYRSLQPYATAAPRTASTTTSAGPVVTTPPQVVAFRRNPAPLTTGTSRAQLPAPGGGASFNGVTPPDFYDDTGSVVNAPLRITTSNSSETLNVWVTDSAWASNSAAITAAAKAFLDASGTSDIYHWETNIYGPPWGPSSYSNLIPDDQTVNILFMPMGTSTDGTVIGFFYPRDNYKRTSGTGSVTDSSNQMVMFYMNSSVYSAYTTVQSNGNTEGENLIISTLAHEFQHMIHFYQKTILLAGGRGTDTWINEMMSMMTEDILSDKVGVDGPRGVSGASAGSVPPYLTGGRLPEFDANDDISLSTWDSNAPLPNYAAAYAFGAFLERNFDGATLLHDMMHNPYTDAQIITKSGDIPSSLSPPGMAGLLVKWATAVLLSHEASTPSDYFYNNGNNWFISSANGTRYNLGSIDAFNYTYTGAPPPGYGPYIYPQGSSIAPPSGNQGPYSNQYIDLGPISSGSPVSQVVTVGPDNYVTLIVK